MVFRDAGDVSLLHVKRAAQPKILACVCVNEANSIKPAAMTESLDIVKNGKRSEVRNEVRSYRLTR